MRFSLRHALLAAASVSLASLAAAQTPVSAYPLEDDCATPIDNLAEMGELYAVKVGGASMTDWLVDTTTKGGASIGLAALSNVGWLVPSNWAVPEAPTNNVHVFITFPNGEVVIDSGNIGATLGTFNFEKRQSVGNWIPAGQLASRGVTLPTDGSQYSLNLGAGSKSFPFGANGAVMVAFAPLVEVNNTDPSGNNCTWGGEVGDMNASGTAAGQGIISGYNVYRMAGTMGAPPTRAAIGAAANWAYYLDLRTINMAGADTPGSGPPGDGTNAPTDSSADNDLTGWDNDDGTIYTADEVVIFSDQNSNPDGSGRAGGVAGPTAGQGYWYAFQPCVNGQVSDFTSSPIAGGAPSDHRLDLDGDTMMDAVDLDGVTTSPEFISPQAEAGLRGLGLTHGGAPLLSAPVFGQLNPAAAAGRLDLTALLEGSNVNITFTTAIEAQNVLGFNVFRVEGGVRSKVNDQIIAARGGEGSVYSVVDRAEGTSRRVRRDATSQYEVDVVYNDGTPTLTVGPFAVTTARNDGGRRVR